MTAARLMVVGAGAGPLKSTVALNVAVAAVVAGRATLLHDLDGASSRALARLTGAGETAALPWAPAPLHVRAPGSASAVDPPGVALVVVDPPPRLDAAVWAELSRCDAVLVPVDAGAVARRALREVAACLADLPAPPRLHVALARVLPRDADRWALLEELDALAPGALLAITLPAGRPEAAGARGTARLYAPGTRAATAYAAVHAAVDAALAAARGVPLTSTSP